MRNAIMSLSSLKYDALSIFLLKEFAYPVSNTMKTLFSTNSVHNHFLKMKDPEIKQLVHI